MNHFLKKISKFTAIIVVVFFSLQFCLDSVLKSDLVCDNTWSKVFDGEIVTDIAIIGNSRAECHYNPNIINSITGLNTYNLGLSGTPINIFDIRWQSFINHNKLPSMLIVDVDYNFLGSGKGVFEKHQYLPYVNEIEYETIAKTVNKDLLFDQYIPLYKYRGQSIPVVSKFKSIFNKDCEEIINGFKVKKKKWNRQDWSLFKNKRLNEIAYYKTFNNLYEEGVSKLSSIIDFCKKNDIEVVLIWSPQYIEVQKFKQNQRTYVDSLINTLANKHKVDYLNFSKDELVYNKANFYNHSHLNFEGSSKFSIMVANFIKSKKIL